MKPLALLVAAILASSAAYAKCSIVVVLNTQSSLPNVEITVRHGGKPAQGANVILYDLQGHELSRQSSDARGIVRFSNLTPGVRHVEAIAEKEIYADLYLEIAAKSTRAKSRFSMDLRAKPSIDLAAFAAAAEMPVNEHLRKFAGIVKDQTGGVVDSAVIEIFPDGTRDPSKETKVATDNDGQFSTILADGIYRARISHVGFRPSFVVFQIQPDGEQKEFAIELRLGNSCGN